MGSQLLRALNTTQALSDQFILTLASPPPAESAKSQESPSPLSLLSTSVEALKAQTAKVSLVAINSPFTPSAIISVLSGINENVLPSLVTAALLVDSKVFTKTLSLETNVLVQSALRETRELVGEIKDIAEKDGKNLSEEQKAVATAATGRIWKVCDQLLQLSKDGVVGLVIQKTKQYLELVKDAIQELKEWDPAEDGNDDEDGFWGLEDSHQDEEAANDAGCDEESDDDTLRNNENLLEEKKHVLRILSPTAQIYPAIISRRLKRIGEWSPAYAPRLDSLVSCLRDIPDLTDESAGSLYEGNTVSSADYADRVLDRAVTAVTITRDLLLDDQGRDEKSGEDSDDFTKWAQVWLKVAEEMRRSKRTSNNNPSDPAPS